MRQMVSFGRTHQAKAVTDEYRHDCQTDRRTQPLRPRRCLGSAERIRRDTVIGQIGTHLHTQDEGWPVQPFSAQQSDQNGLAGSSHLLKQPSTSGSRLGQSSGSLRSRWQLCSSRIAGAFSPWHTSIACTSDEPATHISQQTLVIWLANGHWNIS